METKEVRVSPGWAGAAVDTVLVFALSMGLLDVLLALLGKPWSLRNAFHGLPGFAATQWAAAAVGMALGVGAWMFFRGGRARLATLLGGCVGLAALFVTARLADLVPLAGSAQEGFVPTDGIQWLLAAALAAIAFLGGRFAVLAYQANRGWFPWPRLVRGLPLALALLAAFVWLQAYHIESVRSARSLLVTAGAAALGLVLCLMLWYAVSAWMLRLLYLGTIGASTAAVAFAASPAQAPESAAVPSNRTPQHVFLIIVDTLRADAVGGLGGNVETPHLDALAADSVVFRHAVAPAPWTLPSVASILTAAPPRAHGMVVPGRRLPRGFPTLAGAFQDAGYTTAGIGHNPHLLPPSGLDKGFDGYCWFPRWQYDTPTLGMALLSALLPKRFAANPETADLVDLAIAWSRNHRDTAGFLWLHILDPHGPYAPPEAFRPAGPPPPGLDYAFDDFDRVRLGYLGKTGEERAWIRRLYEAEVRYVDAELGRFMAVLKELDLYDGALIALVSDHGEQFWEHGGIEHGDANYHEEIHVPLMLKLPGRRPGIVNDLVPVSALAPTVLELAGIVPEFPDACAPSFGGLAAGTVPAAKTRPVVSSNSVAFEPSRAVTFGRHKYLRWLVSGREEVYDLQRDPGEQYPLRQEAAEWVRRGRGALQQAEAAGGKLRQSFGLQPLTAHSLPEPEIAPETEEALRALGYIE